MKKIILWFSFIILLAGISFPLVSYFQTKPELSQAEQKTEFMTKNTIPQSQEDDLTDSSNEEKQETVQSKIEALKKRLALKWLIIEGDSYFRNQQLPLALKKYTSYYKSHPNDPLIIQKIANTYFEMHKYSLALSYYTRIPKSNTTTLPQQILAELYSTDITNLENRRKLIAKIENMPLSDEDIFYYTTTLSCVWSMKECKTRFKNYFESNEVVENSQITEIRSELLLSIREALLNFENFRLDEEYLEDAYIIAAIYQKWLYPISIALSETLLAQIPGYKPARKIIAQSYFEMWKNKEAKDVLTEYYNEDDSDPDVSYILGIINEQLGEYILANVYLKKALKLNYKPAIDIQRQLVHNFYLLENDSNMLKTFKEMVGNENELEASDLGLAIYYHILHGENDTAYQWALMGKEKFPENGNFHAYEAWILREKWDIETALRVLQNASFLEKDNPFIILNIGYTLLLTEKPIVAQRHFKKVLEIAPSSEFAKQAEKELQNIESLTQDS